MNILWLSHFVPYPPKGGSLQRSYNLIYQLAKKNSVWLISLNQSALLSDEKLIDDAKNNLLSFLKKVSIYDINTDKGTINKYLLAIRSLVSLEPYFVKWLENTEFLHSIQDCLVNNDIDLIHVDTIGLIKYLPESNEFKKVLNHHNIESNMLFRRAEKEKNIIKKVYYFIEGWKIQRLEEKYCKLFNLNITCSDLDSDRLRNIAYDVAVTEIPNGVDTQYFKPDHSSEQMNTLIFAGGLSWYPNIAAMDFFLNKVWPELKKHAPDLIFYIIGRNPPAWIIEKSKNDTSLIITGFVDDVREYINKASIYVCPINDGGGTRLKILDALAMEKALVAHPIACEGIRVVNNETVVFSESVQEYVTQIINLLGNVELRKKLGVSGRELIQNEYSYDKIGAKLNEKYKALCDFN